MTKYFVNIDNKILTADSQKADKIIKKIIFSFDFFHYITTKGSIVSI